MPRGSNNGSATILTSGGATPFTFAWSNGGNSATESNLGAGNYTVTVTDGSGCVSSVSVGVGGSSVLTGFLLPLLIQIVVIMTELPLLLLRVELHLIVIIGVPAQLVLQQQTFLLSIKA